MTEKEIQKRIIDYMTLSGYIVHRMQSGKVKVKGAWMSLCPKGTPDLLCVGRDGYSLWIEVKDENGKCSNDQIKQIKDLQSRGQRVIVARSVGDLTGVRSART